MPRRPLTRRLLATLAATLLAVGLAAPAAALAAPTPTPSSTPAPAAPALSAAPAANGILRLGEALTATATRANPGSTSASSAGATLSIGAQPLADDAALTRWLDGDASGVTLQQIANGTMDATPAGSQSTVTFSVPATDAALAGRAAGVYPLLARTDDGLSAPSVVVVISDGAAPTPLALVVPITAAPLTRGLLSANELADLTAVDGPLSAQLDAVDGTRATLAVDPAIPAAIRVLGSSAPPTAVAWLQRLLALPNDRFALQFGDADLASQLRVGLTNPLSPTSLQSYMTASDFSQPPAVASPASDPSASPGQPALPDLTSLLDIGATTSSVFWPATGSAGADTVATLGALGTPDAPAHVLLPSSSVAGAGGAVPATASVGGVSTPVYDAEVSLALTRAAGENDTTRRGSDLAAALGYLSLARSASADRPVLVVLDRGTDRSRGSLRATMSALTGAPGFTSTTLASITDESASEISLVDPQVDGSRIDDVTNLIADEQIIDRFASILEQPELLTGRERAEVLQVLNVSWTGDAARTAVSDHRAATQTTLDAVGILSSDFRLVSSSAPLRPWVRNDLPWPISVVLAVRPDDARLRVQDRTPVEAQASANTRVEVPVEARLANGEVSVGLQLYSPTGEPVGAPQVVDVEVRAEWESIGLIVVIALVVVFLSIGVVRTLARRRRVAAGDADPAGTEPPGADEPADGRAPADPDADLASDEQPAPEESRP
ncbi:MAG: pyruvate/2-oxoglutarate dehydrogenase complex, dihydrolipoamide acyltransferase component [Microbacterium sp.]|nr:pyruvate/2-oxoglutarate dehydrogenase complex, dihydrolipoamide acyltransferase component [Microbacterium sp.]